MTFTEHLGELRVRIIRSAIAVVVCVLVCFALNKQVLAIVIRPLQMLEKERIVLIEDVPADATPDATGDAPPEGEAPEGEAPEAEPPPRQMRAVETDAGDGKQVKMQVLNPIEPFIVSLKLSAYAGLVLALPYVVYQICAFIFPGLKPNERKAAQFLLVGSSVLIVLGVCMAYFVVFPLVIPYLVLWVPDNVEVGLRLNETVALIIQGVLGFAIAFQFPMVMLILMYIGLITPDSLRRWRRVAIVGIAFGAAIFTPPEPISMLLMGAPLWLLYEMSIVLGQLLLWSRKKKADEAAAADGPTPPDVPQA